MDANVCVCGLFISASTLTPAVVVETWIAAENQLMALI